MYSARTGQKVTKAGRQAQQEPGGLTWPIWCPLRSHCLTEAWQTRLTVELLITAFAVNNARSVWKLVAVGKSSGVMPLRCVLAQQRCARDRNALFLFFLM